MSAGADLSALRRRGDGVVAGGDGAPGRAVAPPARRVWSRVGVPAGIVAAALGLLAYAARETLRAAVPVRVAPVVLRPAAPAGAAGSGDDAPAGSGGGGHGAHGAAAGGGAGGLGSAGGGVVQAPGWVEAEPHDVAVPALAEGVVESLLVLEGDAVEAGQVVARLVAEDAVLARRQAEASLANARAEAARAEAAVAVARARADEAADALRRREEVTVRGAVAEGDVVSARLKAAAERAEVRAAEAMAERARAEVALAEVALAEAELRLSRMEVRSPRRGVVLARLVVPGQRLMLTADDPMAGVVVRVYDPSRLQARVDIPLADAGRVAVGDAAEVTTEALPGRVFAGRVTRFVHEANVQKNTVQVKVSIENPAPELKPEMLVSARVRTGSGARAGAVGGSPAAGVGAEGAEGAMGGGDGGGGGIVLAPRAGVVEVQGERGWAWVVDRSASAARKRAVRLGRAEGAWVEVLEGLRPGDRVIVGAPPGLAEGARVRAHEAEDEAWR
jgi:multidrug efflux pump subunit AcrA (membrane-fusion protein)